MLGIRMEINSDHLKFNPNTTKQFDELSNIMYQFKSQCWGCNPGLMKQNVVNGLGPNFTNTTSSTENVIRVFNTCG